MLQTNDNATNVRVCETRHHADPQRDVQLLRNYRGKVNGVLIIETGGAGDLLAFRHN